MCELLAVSARLPTTIELSLDELARHGGQTGPHTDGWGVAFVQGRDALVLREPEAASESRLLACAKHHTHRSVIALAHIRRATQGPRLLSNTQPFTRELGGRVHLFAHNGMVPGVEADPRFPIHRFRPIGDTDSEHAFCALLERLASRWQADVPSLADRLAVIRPFAAELRTLGPANFLYTDGDVVFVHGHRRKHDAGEIRPPGLHVLCRSCSASADGAPVVGIAIPHDDDQQVALVASVPLSHERWEPLEEGELLVLRDGRVIERVAA